MSNHPDLHTPDHILLAITILFFYGNKEPECRIPPGVMDHVTQDTMHDWVIHRHRFFNWAVKTIASYTPQTFD